MVTDERKGKESKEPPGRVEITWRASEDDERLARCDEIEPKPKLIDAIERELLPEPAHIPGQTLKPLHNGRTLVPKQHSDACPRGHAGTPRRSQRLQRTRPTTGCSRAEPQRAAV